MEMSKIEVNAMIQLSFTWKFVEIDLRPHRIPGRQSCCILQTFSCGICNRNHTKERRAIYFFVLRIAQKWQLGVVQRCRIPFHRPGVIWFTIVVRDI